MLLLQYSAEAGQAKGDITYENVNGVIIIVLMKNSPKVFREYDSKRYIHRFTEAQDMMLNLNKWLISCNRADDILRYTDDTSYLDTLIAEYKASYPADL